MHSSSISSENIFTSPLKGYISPGQISSAQPSNTFSQNLDDKVKAIQMQYQFTSSYGVPQQGQHVKNASSSSSSVLLPNSFNQSYQGQNQFGSIVGNTLKSSSYLQQQGLINPIVPTNQIKTADIYLGSGSSYNSNNNIKNDYVYQPYNNVISNNYTSNSLTTPLKPNSTSYTQSLSQGFNPLSNISSEISKDNLRMKVDEIVNQAKNNIKNSIIENQTSDKQTNIGSVNNNLSNSESLSNKYIFDYKTYQITPSLSSEVQKLDSNQQLGNLGNYTSQNNISSNYFKPNTYETPYNQTSFVVSPPKTTFQASSLPLSDPNIKNIYDQKLTNYSSYLQNQDQQINNGQNQIKTNSNSSTGLSFQFQGNSYGGNPEIKLDDTQQIQNSQFKQTAQISSIQFGQNDQQSQKYNFSHHGSMNNSLHNISSLLNPTISKHDNPLSSNFDYISINDPPSGISPRNNNLTYPSAPRYGSNSFNNNISNINTNNNEIQNQFQNTTLQYSSTTSPVLNYPIQDVIKMPNQQDLELQFNGEKQSSIHEKPKVVDAINNIQQNQDQITEKLVQSEFQENLSKKQFSQFSSPSKNTSSSPVNKESQLMSSSKKITNSNQFFNNNNNNNNYQENQQQTQYNTFETVQNDPLDAENNYEEVEIVKKSKQQQNKSKSPKASPTKSVSSQKSNNQRQKQQEIETNQLVSSVQDEYKELQAPDNFRELNQWLDPVFQDFIKKNFTKQQKKILIEQLSKQIQSDNEDQAEEEKQNQINKKNKDGKSKNISKSNKQKSPSGSPNSNRNSTSKNKTLNLYQRYNQLKSDNKNTSPSNNQRISVKGQQDMNDLENQASKLSSIKEIRTEQEQQEYIQFSQRCKAELERQKIMKHYEKKSKNNLDSPQIDQNNKSSHNQQAYDNKFQSIESIESENCIMTKESKMLLQEIYNEVQNALKKYDYIIQENNKNRQNKDIKSKDNSNNNNNTQESKILPPETLNTMTTNSLKTNNSQMRFETQFQEADDSQNGKQNSGQKRNQFAQRKNSTQSQNKLKQQNEINNNKGLSSLNLQVESPDKFSVISPNNQVDSSPNVTIEQQQQLTSGTDNKISSNQFDGVRISKMNENEAENAFNYRRQEIYKALSNNKQKRNSNQIQQKPMNHSQSKPNGISHTRTPSNHTSNRNSQVIQNQYQEDLNSSGAGFKQRASNILNKFLSPKNSISRNNLQREVETSTHSLKSSLFAGKTDASIQRSNLNLEKTSYQLVNQTKDRQDFFEEYEQNTREDNGIKKQIEVSKIVQDQKQQQISPQPQLQEKVKKASRSQKDDGQQKTRKKSILHIDLIEREAYEITDKEIIDKKKIIKDRKQRVQQIYDNAQQQINLEEKQILQKRSENQILPISDPNIQLSNLDDDGQISAQRITSQNFIKQEKQISNTEYTQNEGISKNFLKRSNSEQHNFFQQKKLAILNDIEDLNKLIERENEVESQNIQTESEENNRFNFQESTHQQQQQQQVSTKQIESKQGGSRQGSVPQSQARSRNNSNAQEFQRPNIKGITYAHSLTELVATEQIHNYQTTNKLVAPPIPLLKIRDQDGSDIMENNEEIVYQQQQQYQQINNRDSKRVNSQHVALTTKDHITQAGTAATTTAAAQDHYYGYSKQKKKENAHKEYVSNSSSKIPKSNKTQTQGGENNYAQENDDNEKKQINIYRSLSPNRFQNNDSPSVNFHERNKKWLEIKKNKIEKTLKNYSSKEMKECTFKPQTNKQLIKYNPYIHKEQIKQKNVTPQNNLNINKNLSPRVSALQKNNQIQSINTVEYTKTQTSHSSKPKREPEDLVKLQGLQSPIMQGYSEVEFWSQSDASVFKAINDIDTSYQAELKKEINDVLDIIQGFQIENNDKLGMKKQLSTTKQRNGSGNKLSAQQIKQKK